jgi:hypothetical protein
MPLFEGVGERIRALMIARGYVRPDGKPDVRRFCLEKSYDKTLFYYWLRDRSSPMKDVDRLAADLGVTKWQLYSGEGPGPKHPIGGGSSNDGTPALPSIYDVLPLNGHALLARLRIWITWAPALQPQWA